MTMRMTPTQPSENIKSLYIAHLRRPFAQQPARLEGATKMETEMEQVGLFLCQSFCCQHLFVNICCQHGLWSKWAIFFDNHLFSKWSLQWGRWGRQSWKMGLLWTSCAIVRLVATLAVWTVSVEVSRNWKEFLQGKTEEHFMDRIREWETASQKAYAVSNMLLRVSLNKSLKMRSCRPSICKSKTKYLQIRDQVFANHIPSIGK